ncbi:MAG: aldo/keto reductase [Phycisphaerales bacterium]|nr:MAG: aldo/keto reductase [Phycisphaerales bacterium]
MRKVRLGDTDVEASVLCLGTDSIGSRIDQAASFELLDLYTEKGGSFIDTANFYSSWFPGCKGGESETTIGRWMKQRGNRSEMAIASKLGFDYPRCDGGLSAAEIQRECEKSLKRLQSDVIDLYYAHRDDYDSPLEETMEAFDRLVKAGKIRAIGASNLKVWRIAEANTISQVNGWAQYCAVSQRYTYLRPRHGADFGPQICINDDLRDYCRSHGVTLVAYSVLLQGAYTRGDRPVPAQFAGPDADARLAALEAVADETGATFNQVVIAWMLQSDPPVLPIIAGSRPEQLTENIAALDMTLTDDQIDRLDTAGNPDIKQVWLR